MEKKNKKCEPSSNNNKKKKITSNPTTKRKRKHKLILVHEQHVTVKDSLEGTHRTSTSECESISNTSNITIEKKIVVTVLDEDGDPIDNGSKNIEVVSMSGNFYEIKVSCSSDYTYGFRFE